MHRFCFPMMSLFLTKQAEAVVAVAESAAHRRYVVFWSFSIWSDIPVLQFSLQYTFHWGQSVWTPVGLWNSFFKRLAVRQALTVLPAIGRIRTTSRSTHTPGAKPMIRPGDHEIRCEQYKSDIMIQAQAILWYSWSLKTSKFKGFLSKDVLWVRDQ